MDQRINYVVYVKMLSEPLGFLAHNFKMGSLSTLTYTTEFRRINSLI